MRTRFLTAAVTFVAVALLAATSGACAASRYAGTYTTLRPGADSTQAITLVLFPDGRAALTTSYPDLARSVGPGVLPISEVATWRDRGATAEVRLTAFGLVRNGRIVQPRHDNNTMSFALQHCRLDGGALLEDHLRRSRSDVRQERLSLTIGLDARVPFVALVFPVAARSAADGLQVRN